MKENIKSAIIAILLVMFAINYFTGYKFEISGGTTTVKPATNDMKVDRVYEIFSEAYQTLNAELATNLYEEQAFYLSGQGPIVQSRDSIRPSFVRHFDWVREEGAQMNIEFDIVDRTISDSLVVDVAYFLITREYPESSEKEDQKSGGKFIAVLRKQENGEWKFKIDGYNPAPAEIFNSTNG